MQNLSCHHRSQEVYSITTLKANHHFISQGTSPPCKDEQPRLKDHKWHTRSYGDGKKILIYYW